MRVIFINVLLGIFIGNTSFAQSTVEGVKLYNYERFTSAEAILKQVVNNNPADINAWYWLVRAYQAQEKNVQVDSILARIPSSLYAHPLYKVILGRIGLQKRDSLQAASEFTAALGTARKKDPSVQLAIAEANIEVTNGNVSYAVDLLNEAARKDKRNPAIYIAEGDAYRKLYNGSESFKNYQIAADLDPSNPEVYYKIGKIYQTQNNVDIFMSYYDKAIAADPNFGPVYYQLYYYYYYKDLSKAFDNLQNFISHTDPDEKNAYLLTDLYYVSKKYNESITEAQKILARQGNQSRPRLYKLLGYSYEALKNSLQAEENLKKYFSVAPDSTYAPEDFELMAKVSDENNRDGQAEVWYQKAYLLEKDTAKKAGIVRKLIANNKADKQYQKQAYWFGQLYNLNVPLTNVDIFNWGVASYNDKNYVMADSIFGIYEKKYPEQTFGYYWRARSNAAIDTAMETGIAIPHYENLIAVGEKDTLNANNRKWLIEAYGYIAAFKVNKEKLYTDALAYYDKILQLDPANTDAEKYKEILEKMIESKAASKPENH